MGLAVRAGLVVWAGLTVRAGLAVRAELIVGGAGGVDSTSLATADWPVAGTMSLHSHRSIPGHLRCTNTCPCAELRHKSTSKRILKFRSFCENSVFAL